MFIFDSGTREETHDEKQHEDQATSRGDDVNQRYVTLDVSAYSVPHLPRQNVLFHGKIADAMDSVPPKKRLIVCQTIMKRCTFCCVKLRLACESKFFFLIKDSFAQPHVKERLHIYMKKVLLRYTMVS